MSEAYKYQRLSDKDISIMGHMPAVVGEPCIDITRVMRDKLSDRSYLTYLAYVYQWGIIQGKRMERSARKAAQRVK